MQPLSIIMTDIDKFQYVNDTFGHHAGDLVLVGYANLMREYTREEDVVATQKTVCITRSPYTHRNPGTYGVSPAGRNDSGGATLCHTGQPYWLTTPMSSRTKR